MIDEDRPLVLITACVCPHCGSIALWNTRETDYRVPVSVVCEICHWEGMAPRAMPLPYPVGQMVRQ